MTPNNLSCLQDHHRYVQLEEKSDSAIFGNKFKYLHTHEVRQSKLGGPSLRDCARDDLGKTSGSYVSLWLACFIGSLEHVDRRLSMALRSHSWESFLSMKKFRNERTHIHLFLKLHAMESSLWTAFLTPKFILSSKLTIRCRWPALHQTFGEELLSFPTFKDQSEIKALIMFCRACHLYLPTGLGQKVPGIVIVFLWSWPCLMLP